MDKFQNKYRIPSARLQGWDYSQNGVYFITICTAGRECLFGDIIVETYDVETHGLHGLHVETHGRASLQTQQIIQRTGVAYRSPKSISSFVAGFKSSATKHINELRGTPKLPVWQPRFHDHIIRNDAEYQRIANYIDTNPENWETDNFFKSKES